MLVTLIMPEHSMHVRLIMPSELLFSYLINFINEFEMTLNLFP